MPDGHLPDLPTADEALRVGVIDTGIAVNSQGEVHPWLRGHVQYMPDEVEHRNDSDPDVGHGSFVAGVVLQQAPTATVLMHRAVVGAENEDEEGQVATAIRELGQAGVTLINLSFGGSLFEHSTPTVISEALSELGPEVVVVAAVANNALPLRTYPAADKRVISVGAATSSGAIAEFSANGDWIDIYAVGEGVVGPYQDGYAEWSGTSFAAATMTGRIARRMAAGMSAEQGAALLLSRSGVAHVWGVNGKRDVRFLEPLA
ncbi:S8 family peptidase [Lentzea atacamensis]|uniref:S8 family peptidase n=1 Tax=Lentzea atacamensis TaxID=531938 RepID=UPI001473D056|nr:S8 family serine peptidase [Lentzea atacamensis]